MAILNSDKFFRNQKEFDMFRVEPCDVPDMTVHVNAGTVIFNNDIINFSEQYSEVITAPKIGTWLVVLSINEHGELVYTYGVQSTEEKKIPSLPERCFHLCILEITASTDCITKNEIYDLRQMFTFSEDKDITCTCKCAIEDQNLFTEDDRTKLKEFYDKYEEVELELDEVKALLEPQKSFRMLSDSGLEFEVHLDDEGKLYTKRIGIDDEFKDVTTDDETPTLDYRFVRNTTSVVNVVNHTNEDFMTVNIKVKSYNVNNEAANCMLVVKCNDATLYCANCQPQYAENEYTIHNIALTKAGYFEQLGVRFHHHGEYKFKMSLYNTATQQLIDTTTIQYNVTFIEYPL